MADRINVCRDGKAIYDIVLTQSFDGLKEAVSCLPVKEHKICIVTDSNVAPLYLEEVRAVLAGCCKAVSVFTFPAGEENKHLLHHADALYLIPSKLRLLAKYISHPSPDIKTILAGSQSLGHGDIVLLKAAYPNSCCFLYYGASELSYVTWLTDQEMNDNPACIGKPFPGVDVTLRNGEIYVDTPYSAIGITGPYSVGDMGYTDHKGYLYFNGRKDNVYNIHGRKVSAVKIENALNSLTQIQEAAVILQNNALQAHVVLTVPNPSGQDAVSLRRIIKRELNDYLESWEIPRDIIFHENLPKNNSGKTVKRLLSAKE